MRSPAAVLRLSRSSRPPRGPAGTVSEASRPARSGAGKAGSLRPGWRTGPDQPRPERRHCRCDDGSPAHPGQLAIRFDAHRRRSGRQLGNEHDWLNGIPNWHSARVRAVPGASRHANARQPCRSGSHCPVRCTPRRSAPMAGHQLQVSVVRLSAERALRARLLTPAAEPWRAGGDITVGLSIRDPGCKPEHDR